MPSRVNKCARLPILCPVDWLVEKALREQEQLIQSHIDTLLSKLHEQIDGPSQGRVNIVRVLI